MPASEQDLSEALAPRRPPPGRRTFSCGDGDRLTGGGRVQAADEFLVPWRDGNVALEDLVAACELRGKRPRHDRERVEGLVEREPILRPCVEDVRVDILLRPVIGRSLERGVDLLSIPE